MKRRRFLQVASGVVGTLAAGKAASESVSDRSAGAPNLLVLHTDQQSLWTLSAYGGTLIATPHIDSLANEGALFTNFFTNHAVCTASRGCLVTGRYPHAHGAWKNDVPLDRDEITFAQVLLDQGYETGYAGKWHLDGEPKPGWMKPERSMGFSDCRFMFNRGHYKKIEDQPDGPPKASPYKVMGDAVSYTTDWLATKTIEFIRRERTRPFCYMVSFPDPHTPFTVRPPYDSMFSPERMPLPVTFDQPQSEKPAWAQHERHIQGETSEERKEWLRRVKAQYCGEVKCIDDNVGQILTALRESGELDRTLVIFTTDHGEFMGEHGLMHKGRPYETAYHIPLLMRWPNAIPAGTVVKSVVSTVDFMPTILGLMGMPRSGREQGHDASGLLTGEALDWKDEAFMHRKATAGGHLGVWTPDYELAYVKDSDPVLFDRKEDPNQVRNLFDSRDHAAVVDRLTTRLIEHCEQVGDPEVSWLKETPAKRAPASEHTE